jgi:hypothetical protein
MEYTQLHSDQQLDVMRERLRQYELKHFEAIANSEVASTVGEDGEAQRHIEMANGFEDACQITRERIAELEGSTLTDQTQS